MSTTVIIGIGVVIILALLSPFFSKKSETKSYIEQDHDIQEKERVFTQLADLEYDYQMGKLAESDFIETKNELTVKAAQFVRPTERNIEKLKSQVDDEINDYLEKHGLVPSQEVNHEN
ncbi:hypothetical protein NC797_14800 [Aquibacillus sp. 3ASR75-11]|uniref:Uncharacterized protein n=1 Tax=Terrihalobacillus insolitus TaxID=2950438 RepID=A0A9X3WYL2_9BACI|nr:hypothetical protein [Terrihalobacillus insolitus]MDC3414549.1 hypothetical protein [Terrihalobacillus insolitus]MDC3425774.1 hypothetical protein [Terrihalobacillus insolitus]